jgi:hypothetical protein
MDGGKNIGNGAKARAAVSFPKLPNAGFADNAHSPGRAASIALLRFVFGDSIKGTR